MIKQRFYHHVSALFYVKKMCRLNKKKRIVYNTIQDILLFGGVGETRTLAPVARSTSLAGKPLHRLGYYSVNAYLC